MEVTLVVAAVIVNAQREVLVALRTHGRNPETIGMYEFPGGKVEVEETPQKALIREIEEELGYLGTIEDPLLYASINTYSISGTCCVLFYPLVLGTQVSLGEGLQVEYRALSSFPYRDVLPGANEAIQEYIERKF